ncbi:DELLA protein RGL1-like [Tripterygium wilfordii]|uniref:DELLA protein RGL1-like n=1 Tax=Tripterygium wilfordii TaxID=458696 RepID=UPI0018F84BDA|nr:DELLA protein RGL1-like [Tripterygium wilfordii]
MKQPTSRLSTEDILRIAGQRFIQSSSQKVEVMPMLSNPFDLSFSGLSREEIEDIELVDSLLASAEKIDRGSKRSANKVSMKDIFEVVMCPGSVAIAYHQEVPFRQVEEFAGIQAILENVAEANKVHIIDIGLKYGVQWTVLMQALATRHECPLELLKITAVGTASKEIEDTGIWLMGFAETLNLPFSFKVVTISDMLDLKGDQFKFDDEEATAVTVSFSCGP